MKAIDFTNVPDQQDNDFKRMVSGAYICKIESVQDVADKEYLKIEYDIAEGQLKGYYADLFERRQFWGGRFIRSYKDTALSFFKAFITAVSNSNQGFAWTSNEQQLVGKKFGAVIAEEEYIKAKGDVGTRFYVAETRSVDAIRKGDFKVPDKKKLKSVPSNAPFTASDFGVDVENLPFK